ncbi:MAG: MotA/TolQ/ExbB proton channel family protein [Helicobacteraceae bacterium]|jgi:biopolymer transport protein ExbB|nr:MotA/TolQ/ExbB proton channel family protein [Helicobacteraceae bacterium]
MLDKDIVEYATFGILAFFGFAAIWIAAEKLLFYKRFRPENFANKSVAEIALFKRLTIIASIAANAPYIGLLGTVFGIMITFIEIANNINSLEASSLMVGLALALKATAAGLFVAIPASIIYNLLLAKAEELLISFEK